MRSKVNVKSIANCGISQLGVLVGLVSTCVQSIGLTQQRKSHLLEDQKLLEEDGHVHRPPYRRRRWQVWEPESLGRL
jgi:hypothetical protein